MLWALITPIRSGLYWSVCLGIVLATAYLVQGFWVFEDWPARAHELRAIAQQELISAIEISSERGGEPAEVSSAPAMLHAVLFGDTGIDRIVDDLAKATAHSIPDTIVLRAFASQSKVIDVAMISTELIGLRATVLWWSVPTMLLIVAAAFAEGVYARQLRRSSNAREASAAHVLFGRSGTQAVALTSATILAWPGSLCWSVLVPIVVGASAGGVYLVVSSFKKYL